MDILTYRVLHLLGIFLLFLALGGFTLRRLASGSSERPRDKAAKLAGATHGIALVLLLVSGFGALASLGLEGIPGWVWAKLVIWLVMGGIVAVIRRAGRWTVLLWWTLPLLGVVAAWLALYKPF